MILRRPQGQVLGQATHCVQYIDWHCYKGSTPKATGCKTRDAPLLCHCEVPQTLLVNIGVAVIYMAKPSSCKVQESEASECGGSFSDGRWEGFMPLCCYYNYQTLSGGNIHINSYGYV